MSRIAERLKGSDLRSIGDANAVADELVSKPGLVAEAVRLLSADDAVLRARTADALEKASAIAPAILRPHKRALLRVAAAARQQEVRWHLAQMLPRLELTVRERAHVVALVRSYLDDPSRIVAVCALHALWDLAVTRQGTRPQWARALVRRYATEGAPSLRARARRLLREDG
jgi:hypothetical protein